MHYSHVTGPPSKIGLVLSDERVGKTIQLIPAICIFANPLPPIQLSFPTLSFPARAIHNRLYIQSCCINIKAAYVLYNNIRITSRGVRKHLQNCCWCKNCHRVVPNDFHVSGGQCHHYCCASGILKPQEKLTYVTACQLGALPRYYPGERLCLASTVLAESRLDFEWPILLFGGSVRIL